MSSSVVDLGKESLPLANIYTVYVKGGLANNYFGPTLFLAFKGGEKRKKESEKLGFCHKRASSRISAFYLSFFLS